MSEFIYRIARNKYRISISLDKESNTYSGYLMENNQKIQECPIVAKNNPSFNKESFFNSVKKWFLANGYQQL